MKLYNQEDNSLIQYYSIAESEFEQYKPHTDIVHEYAKLFNRHYDLVSTLEEKVTKLGFFKDDNPDRDSSINQIEGYNM